MTQLSLFEQPLKKNKIKWQFFFDGASRNNPGPAGAGICIIKDGAIISQYGFYLGVKTNNQAEYAALLLALYLGLPLVDQKTDVVELVSDSELLVRQVQGIYKVKDENLKKLYARAIVALKQYNYTIRHVLRDQNCHADQMANQGVDKKTQLPEGFLSWISNG